jgi:hypothetical protein
MRVNLFITSEIVPELEHILIEDDMIHFDFIISASHLISFIPSPKYYYYYYCLVIRLFYICVSYCPMVEIETQLTSAWNMGNNHPRAS